MTTQSSPKIRQHAKSPSACYGPANNRQSVTMQSPPTCSPSTSNSRQSTSACFPAAATSPSHQLSSEEQLSMTSSSAVTAAHFDACPAAKQLPALDLRCVKSPDSMSKQPQCDLPAVGSPQRLELPQTARSSQSSATHVDHHDWHDSSRSDSSCADTCKPAVASSSVRQACSGVLQPACADTDSSSGTGETDQTAVRCTATDDTFCWHDNAALQHPQPAFHQENM